MLITMHLPPHHRAFTTPSRIHVLMSIAARTPVSTNKQTLQDNHTQAHTHIHRDTQPHTDTHSQHTHIHTHTNTHTRTHTYTHTHKRLDLSICAETVYLSRIMLNWVHKWCGWSS